MSFRRGWLSLARKLFPHNTQLHEQFCRHWSIPCCSSFLISTICGGPSGPGVMEDKVIYPIPSWNHHRCSVEESGVLVCKASKSTRHIACLGIAFKLGP